MDNRTVIACDMSTAPDTPAERTAEYGRLFGQHLVGKERTAEGIRFRLRAEEGVEAWVRDLSIREKACCPFADFEVATVDGEIKWDITVVDDDMAARCLKSSTRYRKRPARTGKACGADWPITDLASPPGDNGAVPGCIPYLGTGLP